MTNDNLRVFPCGAMVDAIADGVPLLGYTTWLY